MRRARIRSDAAEIAHVGAAVRGAVAVERFAPVTLVGQAETVAQARLRGEIANDRNGRVVLRAEPEKGEHRLLLVVDHDPAKAVRLAIARIKGGGLAIELVEMTNPILDALMRPIVEQPPGKRLRCVPLICLAKLLPH